MTEGSQNPFPIEMNRLRAALAKGRYQSTPVHQCDASAEVLRTDLRNLALSNPIVVASYLGVPLAKNPDGSLLRNDHGAVLLQYGVKRYDPNMSDAIENLVDDVQKRCNHAFSR